MFYRHDVEDSEVERPLHATDVYVSPLISRFRWVMQHG